ncbi:MAG: SagB/ThcOx family dehydrogenase, partial [bacterium]|nr:SagB/ThcOx family dehydrogenase [bacterium]
MQRFRSVVGQEFMEKTKYRYAVESDQMKELPQPPLDQSTKAEDIVIDLPSPESIIVKDINLYETIVARKSWRKYSDAPITLDELTYLLWCTQGVKQVTNRPATLRTVPSAGSRHPFETYLLVNNVIGLKTGVYRYAAIEHKLVQVYLGSNLGDEFTQACYKQPFAGNNAVTFMWAVDAYRSEWRYSERAYRYMHLDAGHVCQNLYLAAEAIDCGVCAIAAFDDDQINSLLRLDGKNDFVI